MHPIFTLSDGSQAPLPELFSRITAGESFDLTRCDAVSRFPVVTAIAIQMVAIRKYAATPPVSAEDWAREWMAQVGPEALRVLAPETEVGYFQTPLDADGPRSSLDISDIGMAFNRLGHAVKPVDAADAEVAVFALMSGAWKVSVAKWHGSSRTSPCGVLASTDGSFSSEVRHLIAAYESSAPAHFGVNAKATRAGDHFLWMRPIAKAGLNADQIPWPFLDNRPLHLVEVSPGMFSGVGQHSAPRRVHADVSADDPHTPIIEGRAYRLGPMRGWSMNTLHEIVFGSERTLRPRTLSVPGYSMVRVSALIGDQGKTVGYRETVIPLSPESAFSLFSNPDRVSSLSRRAIEAAKAASGALWYAVGLASETSKESNTGKAIRASARAAYYAAAMGPLTQKVVELLALPEDEAAEQEALSETALSILWVVWGRIRTGYSRPLAVANAQSYLLNTRAMKAGGSVTDLSPIEKRCYAALSDAVSHLTPEQKAKLRTMVAQKPALAYYSVLSQMPETQAAIWPVVIPALGRIPRVCAGVPGYGAGRALADTGYPESRMSRLLSATGDSLVSQLACAIQWCVSHDVERLDLSTVAAWAIADETGDTVLAAAIRDRVALDYVRGVRRASAAAAA